MDFKSNSYSDLAILALFTLAFGCSRPQDETEKPSTKLGSMASDLIDASKARRMLMNTPVPASIPADVDITEIESFVTDHPDYTAYHLLFLLHDRNPKAYATIPLEMRAKVLCSALANSALMNDWGYLDPDGCTNGVSANALLGVGKAALPYLKPLLDDKDDAFLFGSEEATASFDFRYRRADFAYRYAMLILGQQPTFPPNPTDRDKLIDALKNNLQP